MNKNSSNSKFKFSGTLLLLLLTLLAGALFLYRKIGVKPKAAPGVPTLSFAIDPVSVTSSQNFDLILNVNPNNASFYAFELYTSFDPSKIEFQDNANLAQNITSTYLLVKSSVDTINNLITIIGTRTGSPFTGSSDIEIARVKMKVKANVSGDMVFNWGNNTKLGSNIAIEKVNGTFKIGGAVLLIDIPSVIIDPSTGVAIAQRGQNVDVQAFLTTGSNQVKATDFILPYDDTRLTFQNTMDLAQNIEINPSSGFDTQLVIKNVDPVAKKVTIALQTQTPVQGDNILLATIKFVVKLDAPDGLVELLPDTASTVYDLRTQNVLGCVGGFKLTVGQSVSITPPGPSDTPGPSPTPGPSDTPGPSPTPTPPQSTILNLKIKLQGILSRPNQANSLPVKVTVNSIKRSITKSVITDFNVDNNGIWSEQAVFSGLPVASDYKVYIKGPKHLQKRICEKTPQETFPGSYHCEDGAINLRAGNNNLDFSGIYQLVGDLPQQDGVVNSYDISLARNNIGVAGSYDPAVLALADLNLDGIVDSQDYSLVIAALSIRADEGL